MSKTTKIISTVFLLLCVIWSGSQVGLAQTIDSPSTGGIRFKVKKETTESSSNNEQTSTDNAGSNSTNVGNSSVEDPGKDLSKNSVNPISRNSGNLPSMGEFVLLSLPFIGGFLLFFAAFLFIKKKRNE